MNKKMKALAVAIAACASVSAVAAPFVISNVQITGGTITGLSSPLPIASGGTNAATATAALSSLGAMPLAGGTHTGNVVMQYPTAATQRQLAWYNNTSPRWTFSNDGVAEGGSNAGSNFIISRYTDAGAYIDNAITVTRSSGLVTLTSGLVPNSLVGIVGTTTNDTANAGSVGEYPTPATTTGTSLTTNTATNCTSKSLTAGDWDVQAVITYIPAGSTNVVNMYSGVSATSATFGGFGSYTKNQYASAGIVTGNTGTYVVSPNVRISLASTSTVYAIGSSSFTVSTMTCDGFLRARRVR